jgi:hypothetical protein
MNGSQRETEGLGRLGCIVDHWRREEVSIGGISSPEVGVLNRNAGETVVDE